MCQILILTKNLSADKELRDKLETIGYEVFCSSQLIAHYLKEFTTEQVPEFPVVFFSPTLSNNLVTTLLAKNVFSDTTTFRCDWNLPEETSVSEWTAHGLTGQFTSDISQNELRELLDTTATQKGSASSASVLSFTSNALEQALATFSTKERQLFDILYEKKGSYTTRNDLAHELWHSAPNSSNLAQMSQIVSRIRIKLRKLNLPENLVETNWKEGYRIADLLFQWEK